MFVVFAEEVVNVIVDGGAVPALVRHLQPPPLSEGDCSSKPFEHEVEKGSAFALGLLAVKVIRLITFYSSDISVYASLLLLLLLFLFQLHSHFSVI